MKKIDVLIVEDDADLAEALSDILQIKGYQVLLAKDGNDALNKLHRNDVKLVVSDVQMPGMDGLALLNKLQQQQNPIPLLFMTAYGTIQKAVAALQSGAVDYLVKPFDANTLVAKVEEYMPVNQTLDEEDRVVADVNMQRVYSLAAKVAEKEVTVLLEGDSGTGKEVIARFIHANSKNRQGPFIAVNCAAIPENMLEAMLFGYEKGAFTGAHQATPGKFELAQDGTLLLDEISEMDLNLQAKILRVLQEKEVERLGGNRLISLNARVLATTNLPLKKRVEKGLFREDLYYRLSVFPLKIPSLRQRTGDILPLAESLLRKHSEGGKKLPVFTASAKASLLAYDWPGNVRELENLVQRALIVYSGDQITQQDLIFEEAYTQAFEEPVGEFQAHIEPSERIIDGLDLDLKSVEEKIILQTLREEDGSRKITAEKLGISPRTLRYKIARMKEAGLAVPG
ncbi:MAG: sigma-54 dependent transcriptional regulator [Methylococcaceae bacterium]